MTNNMDSVHTDVATDTWQLNALTAALGDLTLTVTDSLSVGRGSDNDVVLGSKQVSRNHALLSVLDGQLYVKDLDSSNGTFINEQRIEGNKSSVLQLNDTIGFASFSFQVNAAVTTEPETQTENKVVSPVVTQATTEGLAADINTDNEAFIAQPVAEENIIEAPVGNETLVTESIVEESVVNQSTVSEVIADAEVVKKTGIEDMLPTTDTTQTASTTQITEPVADQPVIKETGIDEVLSSTESVKTAPIIADSRLVAEQPAAHEEPAVQPEHDKTTKTALQEEADPDVLRAKQAATSQFSGTANLGQSRDLGTEGNNAMDQAISNPANAGQVEKKPSGSWFIWVFVAIIIIGLALWLFNMGGA